ncbi:Con-6 family conserved fungal protein [Schizosaccharomyces pombe]|uniref:UPF0654 protein C22G7.11c n=1 Tax=Schizosaccharomyces pombe (strain 972 / ATCC 24843) TaxID=284812 RepID=YAAB_SCHPO|nr:uncharacterized protein SPAC22G7.11c [Schizosaccharomyces pombe]Q09802.2 RecName: Full=UPF0654 protein C22G7.11c [Schizosaccharomyces pombe 972h-]CAA91135.2 conserved fungal protein [Schizosaccharomyces pombe]|eukprot:NP_593060.2 uncharacterized protein SPAC22G7.11c [Schizosaccharomyces pombe]
MPDPNRVLAGKKATLHNPNVSQQAKERAEDYIESHSSGQETGDYSAQAGGRDLDYEDLGDYDEDADFDNEEGLNVLGDESGFVDDPMKTGDLVEEDQLEGKNIENVRGGYKATMHNPNVSKQAKTRAQRALEEIDDETQA